MAGFGKALEIRTDPNAQRAQWVQDIIDARRAWIDRMDAERAQMTPEERVTDLAMSWSPAPVGSLVFKGAPGWSKVGKEIGRKYSLIGYGAKGMEVGDIPDNLVKVKPIRDWQSSEALKDVMEHPELYKIDPPLGEVVVRKSKQLPPHTWGQTDYRSVQHPPQIMMNEQRLSKVEKEVERSNSRSRLLPKSLRKYFTPVEWDPLGDTLLHETPHVSSAARSEGPLGTSPQYMKELQQRLQKSYDYLLSKYKTGQATAEEVAQFKELESFMSADPDELYRRTLGEYLAREQEVMRHMPAEQRAGYQPGQALAESDVEELARQPFVRDLSNLFDTMDYGFPVQPGRRLPSFSMSSEKPATPTKFKQGMADVVKEFEQKWGPAKDWGTKLTKEQWHEFIAAKEIATGEAEKALAKQSPKTSSSRMRTKEVPEPEPAASEPIGMDDMPPESLAGVPLQEAVKKAPKRDAEYFRKNKPPVIGKGGKVVEPTTETEALVQATTPEIPTDVIGETLAKSKAGKPSPRARKPKEANPNAPAGSTATPEIEAAVGREGWAKVVEGKQAITNKEYGFRALENRLGKPRIEFTPEELIQARELAFKRAADKQAQAQLEAERIKATRDYIQNTPEPDLGKDWIINLLKQLEKEGK